MDTVSPSASDAALSIVAAPDVLSTPRALARFLCGLSSPRLGRARLGKNPLFGVLEAAPFLDVLAWATQHSGLQQD